MLETRERGYGSRRVCHSTRVHIKRHGVTDARVGENGGYLGEVATGARGALWLVTTESYSEGEGSTGQRARGEARRATAVHAGPRRRSCGGGKGNTPRPRPCSILNCL
jgi:hypothetical protein